MLVDSEAICTEVLIDALAASDVQVDSAFFNQHFLGRSYQHLVETVFRFFNIQLPVDFEINYQKQLLEAFSQRLKPCEGVKQVLDKLAVKTCVATSSHPNRTKYVLDHLGLTDYFQQRVYTVSQVKRGKPAPDLFIHAAKQMKVSPEHCLVIEDSNAGLQAAKSAGMMTFHYVGGGHLSSLREQDYMQFVTPAKRFNHWNEFDCLAHDLRQNEPVEVTK